jgi:hypothetical protein
MANYLKNKILITSLICLSALNLKAQEKTSPTELKYLNSINLYVGLLELNLNYERNILQNPHSYSNVRAGFGYWTNLQLEGTCIEGVFVHVLGRKSSHPEFNLGIKYIIDKAGKENAVVPLLYSGYRYEDPEGSFIFRIGLTYPSIFNLGIGFKF